MHTNRVSADNVLVFINAQYAVFLGVVFNFSFSVTHQTVEFAIAEDRVIVVILLVLYFILDWLTTHIIRQIVPATLWRVLLYALAIIGLSIVIVMMNSNHAAKYILLGGYCFLVGCYDLYMTTAGPLKDQKPYWTTTCASIRLVLASAIILFTYVARLNPTALKELDDTISLVVLVLVVLKLIRAIIYAQQDSATVHSLNLPKM